MTNTVTGFRVTAGCSFCGRRYTPQTVRTEVFGLEIRCDDTDSRLCCDDCLHDQCGRGHATDTEVALCEGDALYPAGEADDFDYDAWFEANRYHPAE